MIHIRDQTTG